MSLNKATLEELKEIKEIVDCLIDYSSSAIIRDNFVNAFYTYTLDGVLYGSFRLFGTKSFRLTSSNPNLLNLPATGSIYAKAIKQCFVAKPGWIFYIIDLEDLEDRVIANLSGDLNKCAIFLQGIDGHCLNSYAYYKDEIEAILPRDNNEELFDYIKRYHQEIEKGNKDLKAIRQKSKPNTFLLNYGGYPNKLAKNAKLSIKVAQEIFDNYHKVLYKDITKMREEQVLPFAIANNKIHMGLGCCMNTSNPKGEIRTLFNAYSQFWSILTLLTLNKFNHKRREVNLVDDVRPISSIYDSIYIHMKDDTENIKWVNDTIVPILTKDFLKNQVVKNEAVGEIGYTWHDTVKISNGASIEEINNQRKLLKEM